MCAAFWPDILVIISLGCYFYHVVSYRGGASGGVSRLAAWAGGAGEGTRPAANTALFHDTT